MRGASTPQARGELQEIGGDDVEGLRIGHRIAGAYFFIAFIMAAMGAISALVSGRRFSIPP